MNVARVGNKIRTGVLCALVAGSPLAKAGNKTAAKAGKSVYATEVVSKTKTKLATLTSDIYSPPVAERLTLPAGSEIERETSESWVCSCPIQNAKDLMGDKAYYPEMVKASIAEVSIPKNHSKSLMEEGAWRFVNETEPVNENGMHGYTNTNFFYKQGVEPGLTVDSTLLLNNDKSKMLIVDFYSKEGFFTSTPSHYVSIKKYNPQGQIVGTEYTLREADGSNSESRTAEQMNRIRAEFMIPFKEFTDSKTQAKIDELVQSGVEPVHTKHDYHQETLDYTKEKQKEADELSRSAIQGTLNTLKAIVGY